MLTLATAATTYWWPIEVRQPSLDEPGKFVTTGFEAQFRHLSNSANQTLLEEVHAHGLTDPDVVPRIVTGFRNVEDHSGQPVAFSPDALQRLADMPGVATAVVRAFFASRSPAATTAP